MFVIYDTDDYFLTYRDDAYPEGTVLPDTELLPFCTGMMPKRKCVMQETGYRFPTFGGEAFVASDTSWAKNVVSLAHGDDATVKEPINKARKSFPAFGDDAIDLSARNKYSSSFPHLRG